MTTIGMLHHRLNPETVLKSYAFAAVAKAEGADFFYFTPRRVNFETRTIEAKVLESGVWQERTVPFPDVIYNAGSPEKLAASRGIITKLKKEIPFTTHSIGNKWNVAKRLTEAGEFSKYLIPSNIVTEPAACYSFFAQHKKIVFKPVDGRKGKGIYFISSVGEEYTVQHNTMVTRYTKQALDTFFTKMLSEDAYLIQPYIESKLASGQVFDFRVHVQKNGTGNWTILTVYPRVAPTGSNIPNINNGGYTNYLEPFLALNFPKEAFNMKRTLEQFGLALARHLDDIQMKKFGEVIDEIGIDVGLDARGKLWIYEVNWRPGCPPAFYLELDVVRNTIGYAIYLANNQQAVKEKIRLAKEIRVEKKGRPIISITGSAGKTTTKAFLASILGTRMNVFQSKDYWNTTEHTKQHAELITAEHEAVVLEYGMAYPGVITEHCRIIQPTISIVTNIGLAHVGNFDGKIEGVAHAKSELIHGMDQHGLLVVNADDDNSRLLETKNFKGKILTVGIHKQADYQAYNVLYNKEGMQFKIKLGGKEMDIFIPILGEHHVYNALSAIAVADQLGLNANEIKRGANFKKPPRRLTLYHLRQQITVIDDTVHSHPQGARAAIDVLTNISKKRKIAIIGQMRELGDLREEEYKKLGAYIAEQKVDVLITYGFRTEEIGAAAVAAGLSANQVHHFVNKEKLHKLLDKLVKRGDTILVKGASKTNMFETVKYLDGKWGL
ncbi:MAG: YheC/YheD family protein [Solibacillus sp.]